MAYEYKFVNFYRTVGPAWIATDEANHPIGSFSGIESALNSFGKRGWDIVYMHGVESDIYVDEFLTLFVFEVVMKRSLA